MGTDPGLRLLGVYFSPLWCLFFLSSVEVGLFDSPALNCKTPLWGRRGISPPHNFVSGLLTLFGDLSPVKINVVVSSQSNFSGAIRGIYSFGEAIFQLMLGTASPWLDQSLSVFDFVFLVIGLPSIVSARFGFQDLFSDFALSPFPSLFLHLFAAFIASLVALPFTIATRDLDNVFVRVCYVGLKETNKCEND
ncbi:hypothetical protein HID58_087807 [Brassica napus]|uniref:Uncharacterized protein n=1 Tax=Brassica napus TaxID=3708 RepID=A0ABQ7XUE7_BRANA|nr:hypothetical protein HID58_087807 [Brassica napus]